MDDQLLHETIEAYLGQQMTAEEATAFEAEMATDPLLAERVRLHRIALRATERLGERSLQEKFARWRTETDGADDPPAPIISKKPSRWPSFGILLLLLVGAFWLWNPWVDRQPAIQVPHQNQQQPTDPTPSIPPLIGPVAQTPDSPITNKTPKLFALAEPGLRDYEKKLTGEMTRGTRSLKSPADSLLARVDALLMLKDYTNAADLLEKILPEMPDTIFEKIALKRLAFSRYKMGQPTRAIAAYEKYASGEEDDWVLCLYYLTDWPRHAKEFNARLGKITKHPNHGYYDKAKYLEKQLRKEGWLGK